MVATISVIPSPRLCIASRVAELAGPKAPRQQTTAVNAAGTILIGASRERVGFDRPS